MIIVNKTTLETISEQEFRSLHKNISFPATLSKSALADTDYDYVIPQEAPEITKYQSLVLGTPYKYSGSIRIKYEVVDNTPPQDVILKEYELAIDNLLKAKANEYRYESVYSMISYRGDPNPKFSNEAESMFQWRSAVWTKANEILTDYLTSGEATPPTLESILEQLPEFTLLE